LVSITIQFSLMFTSEFFLIPSVIRQELTGGRYEKHQTVRRRRCNFFDADRAGNSAD
jgi:hypothetical protein